MKTLPSIKQQIEDISEVLGDGLLAEWEEKFMSDIYDQYKRNPVNAGTLSEKQISVIASVWRKVDKQNG